MRYYVCLNVLDFDRVWRDRYTSLGSTTMTSTNSVTREYLETIYNLTVEGDPIVGARLAEKFGVSPPNVAQVLKRMQDDGLIIMPGRGRGRPGEGIELTHEGRAQAEGMLRQHRLAERFLADVLGMDWVQAHEEAHNLERAMTPALEERFVQLLNNPRTCPHGNPIPGPHFNTVEYLREQKARRLSAAENGKEMKVLLISEVVEDESALLTHLGNLEIRPGARITVLSRNEDGSVEVRIVPRPQAPDEPPDARNKEARTVSLSGDLAAKIWVRSPG
jgi:DtxR family Mn-dependent transcriptional regulator